MKIIIDARLYGLENAGLGRYVMNLVSEVCKVDTKNTYCLLLRKKYFDTIRLPKNCSKVLADFGHYTFSEQTRLLKVIQKEGADLVHFPHFNVPVLFRGLYVVTIHDLLMHRQVGLAATTLLPPVYLLKRIVYKTVFKNSVSKAAKIIVPSKAVENEISSYYGLNSGKVEVIYEGFNGQSFRNKVNKGEMEKYGMDGKYFVYTGNAYPHKNLKRLVEAMVLLNNQSTSRVSLAIVSARSIFTKRLQKTINQLNAQKFVKILGFVPDSHLGELYRGSVGLVFPSLSEGFGLPGIEAMESGTLVLASNIPVFKEIYKNNAIYFNQLDFSSIESAMKTALEMEVSERRDRIKVAQEFVKNYSWTTMAQQTVNVYEKTYGDNIRQGK